ncbi:MAG TPA: 3-phosphoshikimate 1-carboxyvinyltransferase [Gammaproteobacteria bacterium]|nr:3-phosphoshikimate 1-carboxyvinyltransferase [Gammaproteobacteria bacterium]
MTVSTHFKVSPGGSLNGTLRIPGDKSISHRALIFGALAEGVTEVSNILAGADCRSTASALMALGVDIAWPDHGPVTVRGAGRDGLRPSRSPLDLGNSGTGLRLLAGVLAGQPFRSELTGDESLRRRPMRRITDPLRQMGAAIESAPGDVAPLIMDGRRPLAPLRYRMPVASAQLKSALLLAGLFADGETACLEPAPTRDHTERLLESFGVEISREHGWIGVRGGSRLAAAAVQVPGDLSSAAFFLLGATIAPDSEVWLEGVGINPTRTGILHILQAMGARIEIVNRRSHGQEPVADLHIRSAALHGIVIPREFVSLAIDEFPALMVAAACAEGETVLSGAEELRVKESDRIAAIAAGLAILGVPVEIMPDGLRVQGVERFNGGAIASGGDHRIAMAFAMAALRADAPIRIDDVDNVATSFPGFARTAHTGGLMITETTA